MENAMAATPSIDLAAPTLTTVCGWYHVHPKFAHAILEMFVGADYDPAIGDIHELLARYAPRRFQLEYAFSTNVRGRTLLKQLSEWGLPLEEDARQTKSYLDIGCAYGGFLMAFASRGYAVTGIEMDEKFARLGRVNLESSGFPVSISPGDFLSDGIPAGEPMFDLITCNDVIEHVSNPEACLRKICRLLKPGGAAYIASPNKLSIPNVRSDVHCQRFGLNLLDYFRARAAYIMYTDYPHYEVSDFYEPEWYVNTARSAGAQAEIVYDNSVTFDAPAEIGMLYAAFAEWARPGSHKLDAIMRHEILREFTAYSARMFQAYNRHIVHNSLEQFAREWIDPLTRILVRMPAA
jgi:2-polyprenyl-3-methyl-5-hydroxy-6-metoxy-1,4-benzoquinol methylase